MAEAGNELTGQIIDAAYKLHVALGPGLLESVYELAVAADLSRRNLRVERQKGVSFEYSGIRFTNAFRVDLVVEGCVLVEIKSVETLAPVHGKQLLTYLRSMNLPLGLLLNFGAPTMKQGLQRVINSAALKESRRDAEPQRAP